MLGEPERGEGTVEAEWVPAGVRVTADFERNTIAIEGPRAEADRLIDAIRRLDVAPELVGIEARIESEPVGRSWHTSTTLNTDQPLVISEETSGVNVEFRASKRDDGRYDLAVTNGRGPTVSKFVVRIRPGETFCLGEEGLVSVHDRRLNFANPLPRKLSGLDVSMLSFEGTSPAGQRIAFQLRRIRSSA
jgi:hypothetical protein